ncbi:glycoside hydrolase family 43 protein [Bacillus sp. AK128]
MKSAYTLVNERDKEVWTADLGDGTYQNPILYADYSDPDCIRVGEDFFMVSSSFHMSPCLPILHSKDLVNWTIINHVCETLPFSSYDLPRHGDGVWAPSIRFHEGKFWVFFSAPDEGVFMSTTTDPYGKWSPLHLVKEVKGWIDPCPFWDDDGQAYLVHAFAKSRIGFKSILQICKMNREGTELLDEGTYVFDGRINHPTIEGPKLYKRNGYYYIFAPAGGVDTGWQTILRSKHIYGPYEDKIVLQQGRTETNGPHQGAWIELQGGESWFLHFQDKDAYGRITHLQPMEWENDWPVMGKKNSETGIGEPIRRWKKPNVGLKQHEIQVPPINDEFTGNSLGRQWQWQANVKKEWFTLKDNRLVLYAVNPPNHVNTLYGTPNILTQKFPAPEFVVTTKLSLDLDENDQAGLVILGYEYKGLMLRKRGAGLNLVYLSGLSPEKGNEETETVIRQVDHQTFFLRTEVKKGAICQFSYSLDGVMFHPVGEEFVASKGKWIGAQIGLFCLNHVSKKSSGFATYDWFKVEKIGGGTHDGNNGL